MSHSASENARKSVLDQFSLEGKVAQSPEAREALGLRLYEDWPRLVGVAMIHSSSTQAPEVATQIAKETGVRVEAFQSDVASRQAITDTINDIAESIGHGVLDIVVANSRVCANIPSLEYDEESWSKNNSVNLDGVMWTAQAASKIFKRQGRGSLIITASVSAILVNIPQT